jgi:hypothetical protein
LARMSNASRKPKVSDPSIPTSVLANDEQNTTLNCRVSRTLRSITLYACSSSTPQVPAFQLRMPHLARACICISENGMKTAKSGMSHVYRDPYTKDTNASNAVPILIAGITLRLGQQGSDACRLAIGRTFGLDAPYPAARLRRQGKGTGVGFAVVRDPSSASDANRSTSCGSILPLWAIGTATGTS